VYVLCIIVKCLSNPWPLDWISLSDPGLWNQATRTRIKTQELPVKTGGFKTRTSRLQSDHLHLGSRANDEEQRTRTTRQELQQANASEQRTTRKSEERKGLLLTSDLIREPRQHRAKSYNYWAKTNDLKRRTSGLNNDVQRKCKMDLQKGAVVEETSNKHEGRLKMTDESIISAYCLRRTSFSLPINRRRRQERRQEVSSNDGSICDLSKGGSLIGPYKFSFGTKDGPNELW